MDTSIEVKIQEALSVLDDVGVSFMLIVEDTQGAAVFSNSTGGTFNVTGFTSGGTGTDTFLTGGTYNNSTGTLSLERNDSGSTINITGFTTGATEDTYVTGVTYNQLTKELTLGLNDGVDFNATGFAAEVTGGTYSGGSITLYKNDGTTSFVLFRS